VFGLWGFTSSAAGNRVGALLANSDAWFQSAEGAGIAENILSWQASEGGWPKNTDTTTAPIKDATDSGAPAGNDAAGRDLAFYFGWRDQGTFTPTVIMVDDFTVGGLLNPDFSTFIPEPGSLMALAAVAAFGFMRKRRA